MQRFKLALHLVLLKTLFHICLVNETTEVSQCENTFRELLLRLRKLLHGPRGQRNNISVMKQ